MGRSEELRAKMDRCSKALNESCETCPEICIIRGMYNERQEMVREIFDNLFYDVAYFDLPAKDHERLVEWLKNHKEKYTEAEDGKGF